MILSLVVLVVALGLISFNLYMAVKNESNGREDIVVKEVYVKWDDNSNFIMAFISEHFKTSNTLLMDQLSLHLGRSTSSLKRKISRLRGVKTNKSPYASNSEREFVFSLADSDISDKGFANILMVSLINIGMSDDDIMDLQDTMLDSKLNK
jgi:hypothetical protein